MRNLHSVEWACILIIIVIISLMGYSVYSAGNELTKFENHCKSLGGEVEFTRLCIRNDIIIEVMK